jgi:hypothetical protein
MAQAIVAERERQIGAVQTGAHPIRVVGHPVRTASKEGISHHEAKMLDEAFLIMRKAARRLGCQLWYVVISGPSSGLSEYEMRRLFAAAKSRLTDEMRRAGIKLKLFIEVLEAEGRLHSNIVLVGTQSVVQALVRSPKFATLDDDRGTFIKVKHVYNSKRLNEYLKYEVTSKTHYRDGYAYPRRRGSHPLGDGGGDRVRPSNDLWRILEAQGIGPRRRTYASRAIPKPKALSEPVCGPITWATNIRGQGLLFDVPPIAANLNEHSGGVLDPSKAMDLEVWRRLQGLTQKELAERAGIAQPTYANAVARRDCLSREAAARLHAVMSKAA